MIRAAKEPNKKKASSSSTSNKKEKKESSQRSSSSLTSREQEKLIETPEVDLYEDYVTCPSCNRRFDAQVAERHM